MNDPQPEGHMASHIERRKFLATLGGAAVACPLAACAQQPTMPVVGFLGTTTPDDFRDRPAALREGLKESGYVEGQNVLIEYRWPEGNYDQLATLAAPCPELLQTNEEHRVRLGRHDCGRHDRQRCRCSHTQSSGSRQHVPLSFGFMIVFAVCRPPQPQLASATGFDRSTENATRIFWITA